MRFWRQTNPNRDVHFSHLFAELEESSSHVRPGGYKSTIQHKQPYDVVKLHMEAEQAKSSKEACKTMQEAENLAIRYLGLRFACNFLFV